jgi:hypothetical protein
LALDIYEMAIRILVASAAGALIGYERYVQEFRIASPETERTDMRAVDNAIEWPVSAGLLYGRCWAGQRPSHPVAALARQRVPDPLSLPQSDPGEDQPCRDECCAADRR